MWVGVDRRRPEPGPRRHARAVCLAWSGRLHRRTCGPLLPAPGGSMWVSTVATVWRIRGNTAFPFDRPNGLPSDKAFAILDDGRGTLWMTSNKGLRAAKIADLDAFADGRLAVLPSRLFGASDGMISAECMLAEPGRRAACRRHRVVFRPRGRGPRRPGAPAAQRAPAAGPRRSRDRQRPRDAGASTGSRSRPATAISRSATPRSAS